MNGREGLRPRSRPASKLPPFLETGVGLLAGGAAWHGRGESVVISRYPDNMSMRAAIEKRIDEFLAADDTRLEWVKPAVRKHGFLPLYLGWVAVLGIRPEGSYVRWDHEDDREAVKTLDDGYWQRLAICQGARRYPELTALIPSRPTSAETCDACGGSGQVNGVPQVICQCGGLGWIIPGEPKGPPPG